MLVDGHVQPSFVLPELPAAAASRGGLADVATRFLACSVDNKMAPGLAAPA